MSAYRFIQARDVLAVQIGDVAIARVVGMGSKDPRLQTRDAKGRWATFSSVDDTYARPYLREYAELALWIRAQVRKGRL